jgi:hypothetical protein
MRAPDRTEFAARRPFLSLERVGALCNRQFACLNRQYRRCWPSSKAGSGECRSRRRQACRLT